MPMPRFLVAAPLRLHAGAVLELTPAQVGPRAAELRALGEGVYEVHTSVQFKAGETIGYAGELPKALASVLVAPPPAAAAAAAPAAPAAAPAPPAKQASATPRRPARPSAQAPE